MAHMRLARFKGVFHPKSPPDFKVSFRLAILVDFLGVTTPAVED